MINIKYVIQILNDEFVEYNYINESQTKINKNQI